MTLASPRLYFCAILLSLLSGCSIFKPTEQPPKQPQLSSTQQEAAWKQHQQFANQINSWQTVGKIAFRIPDDSASLSFRWLKSNDKFHIQLTGPLGQGGAIIKSTDTGVSLSTSDGTSSAENAETLIQQQLGWRFPVESLLYWVRGLPSPHSQHLKNHGNNGLLSQLTQDGWQVSFLRYQNKNNHSLPEKLKLHYGELTVTIIVKEWELKPEINWDDYFAQL